MNIALLMAGAMLLVTGLVVLLDRRRRAGFAGLGSGLYFALGALGMVGAMMPETLDRVGRLGWKFTTLVSIMCALRIGQVLLDRQRARARAQRPGVEGS